MRFWGQSQGAGASNALLSENNLSDVDDAAEARFNLGVTSAGDALLVSENLNDVPNKTAARNNLSVPATATVLLKSGNLADLASTATSRSNLGVYSTSQVDSAVSIASGLSLQKSQNLADVANPATSLANIGGMNSSLAGVNAAAARSSLGVYSGSESDNAYLAKSDNLDDVVDKPAALENIGAADNLFSNIVDKAQARLNMELMSDDETLTYLDDNFLSIGGNLGNIADASTARTNLDVPQTSTVLLKSGNLSGLNNTTTARANLGVYSTSQVDSAVSTASGLSLQKSQNLADVASPLTSRINLGAMPSVTRGATSAQYIILSGRPFPVVLATPSSMIKDQWRYMPFKIETAISVSAIGMRTTAVASNGTAVGIFSLFSMSASTGKPSALQTDYSPYGNVDLTTGPGFKEISTVGLTIPVGEWFIGFAWSGTATISPTVDLIGGFHPTISGLSTLAHHSAHFQSTSGSAVPNPPAASNNGATGVAVWVKLA